MRVVECWCNGLRAGARVQKGSSRLQLLRVVVYRSRCCTNNQSWVSLALVSTSIVPLVAACPFTARSANSSSAAPPPTPSEPPSPPPPPSAHRPRACDPSLPPLPLSLLFLFSKPPRLSTSHGGHTADKRVRTVRCRGGNLKVPHACPLPALY